MQAWPGHAYPLGASYDGTGTNFALFSEVAEGVELCLFEPDPGAPGGLAETRLVVDPGRDGDLPAGLEPELVEAARKGLAWLGPARLLGVPLGAGPKVLGFLVLPRRPGDPPPVTPELVDGVPVYKIYRPRAARTGGDRAD